MKNILQEVAQPYSELHGRVRFVCDWIPRQEIDGKSVINVGCGYGWFERFLTEHREPRRIVGIEPSNADISTARQSLLGMPVELIVASGLSIPLQADSFDTCLCTEVIEHVPSGTESGLLSEIWRVLKPGGKCYLTTPSNSILSMLTDPAYYLIGHRHYSESQISALAHPVGFTVLSAMQKGKVAELTWLYNLYLSKWIFRRGPFCEKWLGEQLDREYRDEDGFMSLFCVLQKNAAGSVESRKS